MTDTADYADIVLPATSQLEQTDLNKGYGHTWLTYNQQAIPPLGESKSNWEVLSLLAGALGFEEPWLHQTPDEIIAEMIEAMAAAVPEFQGITLARLKKEHRVPLVIESSTPFANLKFPTPSGKVELYSQQIADTGLDPLPNWTEAIDYVPPTVKPDSAPLTLLTAAAHHFVTSSMANQESLLNREGSPFVEIHPDDAAARNIAEGDVVVVENGRGWCKLQAVITDAVRPGVVASPKGRWARHDPFQNGNGGRNGVSGRNVNWTVSDALADMAGQSTFHSNTVWLRKYREA
jgi:anaerobic selenocysteine-containing dehydrogenase